MEKTESRNLFRTVSILFLVIGAIGSLGFMFYTGRNNPSVILQILFTLWVLSPYGALLILDRISKRRSYLDQKLIYSFTVFLTILSLIGYSGILIPPTSKPAFVFLVIPFVSWILIGAILLTVIVFLKKES